MSLWGYSTRSDLSRFGNFLIIVLIGIVIVSVVDIFIASSALQFARHQRDRRRGVHQPDRLRHTAHQGGLRAVVRLYAYAQGSEMVAKRSVFDALALYLNFINLFILMLQLLGNRTSSS